MEVARGLAEGQTRGKRGVAALPPSTCKYPGVGPGGAAPLPAAREWNGAAVPPSRLARLALPVCGMTDTRDLEERIAHLIRAVDDLSDVVARQEREIARLTRLVGLLAEREAERETESGAIPLADQKPPHW